MKTLRTNISLKAAGCLFALCTAAGAEGDFRGLWVGQVTLTHVNEVTIPLDENNDAVAPDPDVPTATADAAHLRLILHVNGDGQVNLLKDVAVLRRTETEEVESSLVDSEGDLALVSDERLYSEFPAQEARRIASAAFDFGDYKATEAVHAVVDEIVAQVAATVWTSGIDSASTTAEIRIAEDDAQAAAENSIADLDLINSADAAAEFDLFMIDWLPSSTVDAMALSGMVPPAVSNAAVTLADTFYGDSRGLAALDAIIGAAAAETNDAERIAAARFTVSRYADTDNDYQRFITGNSFGDMIPAAALTAGAEAVVSNATPETISNAVYALPAVSLVLTEAVSAQVARYDDAAASDAVQFVLDAIIQASASSPSDAEDLIATEAETAGLAALAAAPRFSLPVLTPTADYTAFVQSDEYRESVPGAAEAAALDAVSEKKSDPFSTEDSLADTARIAATEALRSVYILAAQARRTELPMDGHFGPGEGDARLTADAGVGSLGAAGLECELRLPASHPTNPFRHPKHPDHTLGADITRRIRMDFDGDPGDAPEHSVTGTERVTGIYREEVFGLHKPLGTGSDTGLKVEGTFELNRVSLIDTLNAQ